MEKDSKKERLKDFKLDHLTFDFRTKDIHLTSCGGDHNRVFKRATKTDDETYFWFGLSCLNNNVLQPVYKGGRISFEAPAGDIDRRIIDWENSRDGQVFNLVRFHELSEKTLPSFMHFEVSVKLNNDEDSAPALIGMPYNNESRFWSCKYRDLTESPLPTRTHFVQFEGFCVCITAYMVNGLLHDNYTFSFAS